VGAEYLVSKQQYWQSQDSGRCDRP